MFGSDLPMISNQLPISMDFPAEPELFREILEIYIKRIASVVNTKEGALYLPQELATFQQYFTPGNPQKNRNTYRKTFDMVSLNGGTIATGATATFPHGIVGISTCTRIFGTATTQPGAFIPLPYASATSAAVVNIFANSTNVSIINGPSQQPLTQAYITLEYIKT